MTTYNITLPNIPKALTVKELLEDHWLIPRKIRHFLRTKKHILVNNANVTWQTPVKAGDHITLIFDQEDYPEKSIPFGDRKQVDCLYEDEHLIIVNKPEGMKTHGNEPTEIALLNHVSAYVGLTCYVVHRLDMETSGAILFAKNPFVLPIINRLLETNQISRQYWALAEGTFPQEQLTYRDLIGRDRHDRRKRIVDSKHGQRAITHITRLKTFDKVTLLNCKLDTGRTHQIRVHLSHHRHALIGDPLYSKKAAQRLMLHAHQLSFTHPFTLEKITVKAESDSFEKGLQTTH
ncbi:MULTISPECIES: RluA family pseudouridine synthase [Streptococcus]|uniref:Pseudouridine synthase n=1 Tax=Streptococcus caledonicus TaxID=2614158 RepID=A0ABW0UED0_9STRE|nr:RluA family pseudouridine synthase [Streptococcus sp. S784/96/1]